jgi:hypothetical protein
MDFSFQLPFVFDTTNDILIIRDRGVTDDNNNNPD